MHIDGAANMAEQMNQPHPELQTQGVLEVTTPVVQEHAPNRHRAPSRMRRLGAATMRALRNTPPVMFGAAYAPNMMTASEASEIMVPEPAQEMAPEAEVMDTPTEAPEPATSFSAWLERNNYTPVISPVAPRTRGKHRGQSEWRKVLNNVTEKYGINSEARHRTPKSYGRFGKPALAGLAAAGVLFAGSNAVTDVDSSKGDRVSAMSQESVISSDKKNNHKQTEAKKQTTATPKAEPTPAATPSATASAETATVKITDETVITPEVADKLTLPEETVEFLEEHDIDEKLQDPRVKAPLLHAEEETGVPWEALAALKYRESGPSMSPKESLTNGQALGTGINVDGLYISDDANEDAVNAAEHFKELAKEVYDIDVTKRTLTAEEWIKAFTAYNRGFLYEMHNVDPSESPYSNNGLTEDTQEMRWPGGAADPGRSTRGGGKDGNPVGALPMLIYTQKVAGEGENTPETTPQPTTSPESTQE